MNKQPATSINAPAATAQINSVVMAQYTSKTSPVSATLAATSDKLNATNNSDGATARTKTFETSNTPIGEVKAIISRCSKLIKAKCLPCPTIAGAAYVRATDIPEVQKIFEDCEAELRVAKNKIIEQWDALREHAVDRMGNFKAEVTLPELSEFVDGFWIKLHWMAAPAPVAGTVFESMNEEVAARIKAASEQGTANRLVDASAQPVRELIKMMGDAVKDIPKAKRLRQERFDKITQKIEAIKELNWSDNDDLDHLHRQLKVTLNLDDAVKRDGDGRADLVKDIKAAKAVAESTLSGLGV